MDNYILELKKEYKKLKLENKRLKQAQKDRMITVDLSNCITPLFA